jgi:hypothetical protein
MNPAVTRNIMVDIETFGRRPNGLVVSIGAVAFSSAPEDVTAGTIFSGQPADEFHALLSLSAAEEDTRFTREPATMAWWAEQQGAAYERLLAGMRASTLSVRQLLWQFTHWLTPFCEQGYNVIGNSPSFDLVLIENACQKAGLVYPVPHRAETDYRTLTDLVWGEHKPRAPENGAHDALFDARFQATTYAKALHIVRGWRQAAATLDNMTDVAL